MPFTFVPVAAYDTSGNAIAAADLPAGYKDLRLPVGDRRSRRVRVQAGRDELDALGVCRERERDIRAVGGEHEPSDRARHSGDHDLLLGPLVPGKWDPAKLPDHMRRETGIHWVAPGSIEQQDGWPNIWVKAYHVRQDKGGYWYIVTEWGAGRVLRGDGR